MGFRWAHFEISISKIFSHKMLYEMKKIWKRGGGGG